MRYLHTTIRVSDPDPAVRFFEPLQRRGMLAPAERWASMPNMETW